MNDVSYLDIVLLPWTTTGVPRNNQPLTAVVPGVLGLQPFVGCPASVICSALKLPEEHSQVKRREFQDLTSTPYVREPDHSGAQVLVPAVAVNEVFAQHLRIAVPIGGDEWQRVFGDRLIDAVWRVLEHRRVGAGDDHVLEPVAQFQ